MDFRRRRDIDRAVKKVLNINSVRPITRSLEDFCEALDAVVDRYREAETITRAEAVGALEFIKHKILTEAFSEED